MINPFDPYIGLIKKMAKPFVPAAKAFLPNVELPKISIKSPQPTSGTSIAGKTVEPVSYFDPIEPQGLPKVQIGQPDRIDPMQEWGKIQEEAARVKPLDYLPRLSDLPDMDPIMGPKLEDRITPAQAFEKSAKDWYTGVMEQARAVNEAETIPQKTMEYGGLYVDTLRGAFIPISTVIEYFRQLPVAGPVTGLALDVLGTGLQNWGDYAFKPLLGESPTTTAYKNKILKPVFVDVITFFLFEAMGKGIKKVTTKGVDYLKVGSETILPAELLEVMQRNDRGQPLTPRETKIMDEIKTKSGKERVSYLKGKADFSIKVQREWIGKIKEKWNEMFNQETPEVVNDFLESAHPKDLERISKAMDKKRGELDIRGGIIEPGLVGLKGKDTSIEDFYNEGSGIPVPPDKPIVPKKTSGPLSNAEIKKEVARRAAEKKKLDAEIAKAEKQAAKDFEDTFNKKPAKADLPEEVLIDLAKGEADANLAGVKPPSTYKVLPEIMAEYNRLSGINLIRLKGESEAYQIPGSPEDIATKKYYDEVFQKDIKLMQEGATDVLRAKAAGLTEGAAQQGIPGPELAKKQLQGVEGRAPKTTSVPQGKAPVPAAQKVGEVGRFKIFQTVEKGISEYVIWGGGGKSPIAYAGTEAKAVAKAKKLEAKAQKIQAKLKPVETTPSAVIEATEAKLPAVDITVVGGKQYALEKSNQSIESAPITPEIEKMIVEKFPDKAEEVIKGQQELAIVEVAAEKALSEDFIEVSEKTLEEINAKIGEIEKVLSPEEKIELEAARERKKKMGGPQAFVDTSPGGQTWPVQTFGKTIGGAINYVKQGSLNTWDQLRSAGYNPAKFVGNLGYKDAKLLKDPKLLEINNDFIIDASTAPYKAEQMWKRVFPDGANPSSVLIASMDKFFRRLLRNERSGHNLPFEYNKENLEINRLENKRDLMGDLEAQKMHNELEVNRVEILEMYRKAGMQISDQMMKDPDYFPIKVWDDFSDFAQGTYNTSRKGKPSHLKRARGSDRNIVENLPQVIIEMYIQAMNYLPVQKMLNSVTDPANGFVLVDPVTGKAERPKGKGSVPEGYVRYSLDRFKFYPKEVLDKGKLQEVITLGGKIDLDNLAEKTIGISEVPDLIIKKEAAAYLDRIKAEKDIRHSTLKSATDLWKFYAISQSPVRYLMNNMFSDALAGVILAPRKAQYIRDYNAILPAMYGYYFNGEPATPAINMARDTAMLETGLTSDVFAEAMFESPEMKETREKLFGQSSAIKSAGLNAKQWMRMQEAAARIALALNYGRGIITRESAAQAGKDMVNYRDVTAKRRGLELVKPFALWPTGMMQTMLRATFSKPEYIKLTPKEQFFRWGAFPTALGSIFLTKWLWNHQDDDDNLSQIDNVKNALGKPNNEMSFDEMEDTMEVGQRYGFKVTDTYIPPGHVILPDPMSALKMAVPGGDPGGLKPWVLPGGGVVVLDLATPLNAWDLVVDGNEAWRHGNTLPWATQQLNTFIKAGINLASKKTSFGGDIFTPGSQGLDATLQGVGYYAAEVTPWYRKFISTMRKADSLYKTTPESILGSLMEVVPIRVLNMNKIKSKTGYYIENRHKPEVLAAGYDRDETMRDITKEFEPARDLLLSRLADSNILPPEYLAKARNFEDTELNTRIAQEAWDFLESQTIGTQATMIRDLFYDLRDSSRLAVSQLPIDEAFDLLYRNWADSKETANESPELYRHDQVMLYNLILDKTGVGTYNMVKTGPELQAKLGKVMSHLGKYGISQDIQDDMKLAESFEKLFNMYGVDDVEMVGEVIPNMKKLLFGMKEFPLPEMVEPVPAPELPPIEPISKLPGVDLNRPTTGLRTLPRVKTTDRKKVELEPISFVDGKSLYGGRTPYNY